MIVIGADTHKRNHALAAVQSQPGVVVRELGGSLDAQPGMARQNDHAFARDSRAGRRGAAHDGHEFVDVCGSAG
jgi:hypothetical protein